MKIIYDYILKKKDIEFILENFSDQYLINIIKSSKEIDGKYYLSLSKDMIDRLLDSLSDLLVEKGLQKDDEPNQIGFKIESLIDVLNSRERERVRPPKGTDQ